MRRLDGVILLAVWSFITALIFFIGIVCVSVFPVASMHASGGYSIALFGPYVGLFFLSLMLAFTISTGIGLLRMREWGRILGIVHAALFLIVFPVGTVIGVLALLYLTRPDVRQAFQNIGGDANPSA